MDINEARIVLAQMQACFMELNLPVVPDPENLNQETHSRSLGFSSYLRRDDCLAHLQASVRLDTQVIQLSMFFHAEMSRESSPALLIPLNEINLSSKGPYWIAIPGDHMIEFRIAYIFTGSPLNKDQFKRVLKKSLDQGKLQSRYLRELIRNSNRLISVNGSSLV
jgi:hypothetical protein